MNQRGPRGAGVDIIVAFKLVKAVALVAIGILSFHLVHRDPLEIAARWIGHFALDPDNRLVHALLVRVARLDARRLEQLGVGTFLYAALFLTEGLGLFFQKRWAEIMTVVITISFLPVEIWEATRKASLPRLLAILVNAAIAAYLIRRLRAGR